MVRSSLAVLTALVVLALGSAARAADFTPLLTGGQVTSQGTYVQDRSSTGTNYDYLPSRDDQVSCDGPTCEDRTDFTDSDHLSLGWQSHWLLDGGYPDVPRANPAPGVSAASGDYTVNPGTFGISDHSTFQGYDDPTAGGGAEPPEYHNLDCTQTMSTVAPPHLYTGGADPVAALDDYSSADPAHTVLPDGPGELLGLPLCQSGDRQENGGALLSFPFDVQRAQHTLSLGTTPAATTSRPTHLTFGNSWSGSSHAACAAGGAGFVNDLNADLTPTTPPDPGRDTATCSDTSSGAEDVTLECALCVTKWDYDQPKVFGGSFEKVPDSGTYDGNDVRITVTVHNATRKTITAPLRFYEAKAKRDLPERKDQKHLELTQTFAPGQTRELVFFWDTSGFAWEKGKDQSARDVRFYTPYGGAKAPITVRPKPVVLVHGLNSSASTWSSYPALLKRANSTWQGFAVGDGKYPGTMETFPTNGNSIEQNALAESSYIRGLRGDLNAAHVDVVGHSMGGLISRYYIQNLMPKADDDGPAVSHLEMLGTPNAGSRCAEWAYAHGAHGMPILQLLPNWVHAFNAEVSNFKGVRYAVAGGQVNDDDGCYGVLSGLGPNDDVVALTSAFALGGDRQRFSGISHTQMTASSAMFTGFVKPRLALDPDDAKVQGRAARLAGVARARGARAKKAKLIVFPTSAGTYAHRVGAHRRATWKVKVGAAKRLTVTVELPAGGTAKLVSPRGRTVSRTTAAAGAFFSVLRARHPARGTWRLVMANGSGGARRVAAAVDLAGGPSISVLARRHGKRVSIAARLHGAAHASRARYSASVELAGRKPRVVKLTHGRGTTGAVARGVLITISARAGGTTSTRAVEAP